MEAGDKEDISAECKARLEGFKAIAESALDEVMPKGGEGDAVLAEAVRYAVGSGGKRIRPVVCMASAIAVGAGAEDVRYAAAAIELLHNYTLVHDDLPSMDNDTVRRGRPAVWKKFGEANAILVGDALQALAFAAAARQPRGTAQIVAELADKALGVVQGQVEDIDGREKTVEAVERMYARKTSDLFVAAAVMGAVGGGGSPGEVEALRRYAFNLGLAFQYEDDFFDGDSVFGRDVARSRAKARTDDALAALEGLSGDATVLKELARGLLARIL